MQKKQNKITNALYYIVVLGILGVGIYMAFFWGRNDYKVMNQDKENAQNIISKVEQKIETKEAIRYTINEEEVASSFEDIPDEAFTIDPTSEDILPIMTDEETKALEDIPIPEKITFEEWLKSQEIELNEPEGAKGYIDAVLSYPAVGITRAIYTSLDWADISYDLEKLYMLTTCSSASSIHASNLGLSRPGAYAIEGHNSLRTNLSMNGLLNSDLGDIFKLYGGSGDDAGIYTYQVTNIYALSRIQCEKSIMNNLENLGNNTCFLITCGRDTTKWKFRYKNMIVQGTLIEFVPFVR